MGSVDVAFTPGDPDDCTVAVVIDVLRATTTITRALESGYRQVLACGELDEARELAAQGGRQRRACRRAPVRQARGIRPGQLAREFEGEPRAETIVLTTTNGTRAIVTAAGHAEVVVIGSLLNLLACASKVARTARERGGDVLIQCAGVRGDFTMDDAYTAGRYVQELAVWLPEYELTDAARAAEALAGSFESAGEGLAASKSARNLRAAGLLDDVRYCAREGVVEVVPTVDRRPRRRRHDHRLSGALRQDHASGGGGLSSEVARLMGHRRRGSRCAGRRATARQQTSTARSRARWPGPRTGPCWPVCLVLVAWVVVVFAIASVYAFLV